MGTYYVFANRTKSVYLEPDDVVPATAKKWQIINEPQVTSLLAWAMFGPWRGDHVVVVPDTGGEYEEIAEWPNVTANLIAARKAEDGP